MTGLSRSRAHRTFAAQVDALDALMTGGRTGPVKWVPCRSPRCRERLAAIRHEPDGVIVFVVVPPAHVEGDDLLVLDGGVSVVKGGVTVRERRDRSDKPSGVWRPTGPLPAIRCAVCGKETPIDMIELARVARGLTSGAL